MAENVLLSFNIWAEITVHYLGVNFINILHMRFLYKSAFLPKRNQKKAA